MRKFFPLVCVLVFSFSAAYAADTQGSVIEEIIARINGSIITRSDLGKAHDQLVQEVREKGGNVDEEVSKHDKDLLRDLIDQQLLIQKGQELGITGDTELIKRLDQMRKDMKLESMEDLEKVAQQQGVSYEDFKQNLRNNIVTQSVISREVGSHIQMTQEEMQQFYNDHKSELERPEQVALSEILIAPKSSGKDDKGQPLEPTDADIAAAQKKAETVLAEVKKGLKFEEAAKKYSDGPTAQQGGDLGDFRRGMLAKELEDKTFALKSGEVTDVIRTKQGFIILKVEEHDQAGVPALKEVEPQIQEAIYLKKLQPALREYLTKLREDAYIVIKPGFVDTAASPNQTAPVFVADNSKPEGKESKKRKKHLLIF